MVNVQDGVLRWIGQQPESIALLLLGLGVVYGAFGFRLFAPLLGLTCAAVVGGLGVIAAAVADLPPIAGGLIGACVGGLIGAKAPRVSAPLAAASVGAVLGWLLGERFHLTPNWLLTVAGLSGAALLILTIICYRTMSVVITVLQGAGLGLLGLVGLACNYVPDFGYTFQTMAAGSTFIVPVVLGMLAATGYSYQEMQRRGDMISGVG